MNGDAARTAAVPTPPPPARRYQVDVRSTGVVMVTAMLARASGYVREAVIAGLFGATPSTDAFFAAVRLHGLASSLGAKSLGRVVVPLYTGYLARGEDAEGERFLGAFVTALAAALGVVSLALAILAPGLVRVAAPGFGPRDRDLAVLLTRILASSIAFIGLAEVLGGALEARRRFVASAVAPLFYNAAYVATLLVLGPLYGVAGAALGVCAGAVARVAALLRAVFGHGVAVRPRWDLAHSGVRTAFTLYRPVIVAMLVFDAWAIAEAAIASRLPAGSLSYLNYAYRFVQVPMAMFVESVATVAFPSIAALATVNDLGGVRSSTTMGLRMVLFLTVPAAVAIATLAQPLIAVFLQHGNFGPAATAATTLALQMYALGLVGFAVVSIASRAFFALHDTRTPALLDAGGVALAIALGLALVGTLRHAGLALGFSLGMTAEAVVMIAVLGRRVGSLWRAGLGAFASRAAAAALITGICTYAARILATHAGLVAELAAGAAAAYGGYLLASRVLRVEELHLVASGLASSAADEA